MSDIDDSPPQNTQNTQQNPEAKGKFELQGVLMRWFLGKKPYWINFLIFLGNIAIFHFYSDSWDLNVSEEVAKMTQSIKQPEPESE